MHLETLASHPGAHPHLLAAIAGALCAPEVFNAGEALALLSNPRTPISARDQLLSAAVRSAGGGPPALTLAGGAHQDEVLLSAMGKGTHIDWLDLFACTPDTGAAIAERAIADPTGPARERAVTLMTILAMEHLPAQVRAAAAHECLRVAVLDQGFEHLVTLARTNPDIRAALTAHPNASQRTRARLTDALTPWPVTWTVPDIAAAILADPGGDLDLALLRCGDTLDAVARALLTLEPSSDVLTELALSPLVPADVEERAVLEALGRQPGPALETALVVGRQIALRPGTSNALAVALLAHAGPGTATNVAYLASRSDLDAASITAVQDNLDSGRPPALPHSVNLTLMPSATPAQRARGHAQTVRASAETSSGDTFARITAVAATRDLWADPDPGVHLPAVALLLAGPHTPALQLLVGRTLGRHLSRITTAEHSQALLVLAPSFAGTLTELVTTATVVGA